MKTILTLAMAAVLSACATAQPKIPETVTVVITKYKKLPAWATDPLPLPVAKDGKVSSHLKNENDRGEVIKVANCDRHLLKKLDAGEQIEKRDCDIK